VAAVFVPAIIALSLVTFATWWMIGHDPVTAMIVKRYLLPIKTRQVDTLILGSNTFAALQPVIQRKIGSQVVLVEASDPLASRVAEFLRIQEPAPGAERSGRKVRLLVSDLTPQVARTARMFMGRHVELERAV